MSCGEEPHRRIFRGLFFLMLFATIVGRQAFAAEGRFFQQEALAYPNQPKRSKAGNSSSPRGSAHRMREPRMTLQAISLAKPIG
jgi:hypothetical protein